MMDNGNTNSLPRRSPQNGGPPPQGQHNSRPQGKLISHYHVNNILINLETNKSYVLLSGGSHRLYSTYAPVNGSAFHHGPVNGTSGLRQGPFVTHVTIREASHTPGSKV